MAILERAKHEAEEIVAKARTDAEALIERRTRMAEDKIAAEERSAVEQLRAATADAAAKAAARLIAERHDAATDAKLVDQAIKEIAGAVPSERFVPLPLDREGRGGVMCSYRSDIVLGCRHVVRPPPFKPPHQG